VDERVGAIRRLIWGTALVVCLATLVMTYYVVARITRPLATLTEAAQAIAAGDHGHKVYLSNRDELGTLAAAFNQMSAELAMRVQQIREDHELLVTVLGSMIEGVVAVDANQRIFFANDTARSLLGLGPENIHGRPLWEMVRHRTMQQAVQDALTLDQPCLSEFEIPGAVRRVVALHAKRLPGDPCLGAVLVFHDVTELRRLENLRQEFVANVSHELKTPLSSIKAYVETLLHGALEDPENNVTFLRRIEEQADRLHGLILDLLRLARVETGQEVFEITTVPLGELIHSCVAEHRTAANAKRIALDVESHDGALCVRADEEGVRTILNNLVDNAIKYTPDGGRVTIRWNAEDSVVELAVQDTGIGISPEDQARIFERFYRVDKARSRELGGTGLGLAIVKHLAQAFGGSVAVSSAVGRGSTFTVRFPRASSDRLNG
jgi:two-component system phosphate regulon sensor histidine kinase PhoR